MNPWPLVASLVPLLADSSSDAYRVGYIIGTVIAAIVLIAFPIFSIVAVVKAFTRRTTGWIVIGSICGVMLAVFVAVLMVGFARGFKEGMARARNNSPSQSTAAAQPENVTGEGMAFVIQKPAGWQLKRKESPYEVLVHNNKDFIGVIAEEADLGGPENVRRMAKTRIATVGADSDFSDDESVEIDGRKWLAFTVKCRVQNIPFAYQFYIYSGSDGTFQIIGWTFQNLWDRDSATIRKVMQTFRFPPSKGVASARM